MAKAKSKNYAKAKPKSKGKYYAEYTKQRSRALKAFRRQLKAGYVLDFDIPDIPQKILKKHVEELRKITPTYIRQHGVFISAEGEQISATEEFARRRSESAKQSAITRKVIKELSLISPEEIEAPIPKPSIPVILNPDYNKNRLEDESVLPHYIVWNDRLQQYMSTRTGEAVDVSKIPNVQNITAINFVTQTLKGVAPTEFFNKLLDILTGPLDPNKWYPRRVENRNLSSNVMDDIANTIRQIAIDESKAKEVYQKIQELSQVDQLVSAIYSAMYGYDERAILPAFNLATNLLLGTKGMKSAEEIMDSLDIEGYEE